MAPISPLHIGGALLIALGTGFIFALYPAYKASRFDPIEALRYSSTAQRSAVARP